MLLFSQVGDNVSLEDETPPGLECNESLDGKEIDNSLLIYKGEVYKNRKHIAPLTPDEIESHLKRIPLRSLNKNSDLSTLSKEDRELIMNSVKGSANYNKEVHRNINLFFKTILSEPAYSHYLDHVIDEDGTNIIYFIHHFRNDKSPKKWCEFNDIMVYFVLKCKKSRPRKKDKDKSTKYEYDSTTFSVILKRIFSYFSFFNIKYSICEFNVNGGFCTVIESKWKKIMKEDPDFGTGYYASYYDEQGDHKMRELSIVAMVYNDK